MSVKLGLAAKLYTGAAALTAADAAAASGATWTEADGVKDVTMTIDKGEADTTTRANNGWSQSVGTLKKGSIDIVLPNDSSEAAIGLFRDAFLNNTEIACAVMDGAIATAGSQGLVSNFSVLKFQRSEAMEEAQTISVTIKPSSFTQWYVAS